MSGSGQSAVIGASSGLGRPLRRRRPPLSESDGRGRQRFLLRPRRRRVLPRRRRRSESTRGSLARQRCHRIRSWGAWPRSTASSSGSSHPAMGCQARISVAPVHRATAWTTCTRTARVWTARVVTARVRRSCSGSGASLPPPRRRRTAAVRGGSHGADPRCVRPRSATLRRRRPRSAARRARASGARPRRATAERARRSTRRASASRLGRPMVPAQVRPRPGRRRSSGRTPRRRRRRKRRRRRWAWSMTTRRS